MEKSCPSSSNARRARGSCLRLRAVPVSLLHCWPPPRRDRVRCPVVSPDELSAQEPHPPDGRPPERPQPQQREQQQEEQQVHVEELDEGEVLRNGEMRSVS